MPRPHLQVEGVINRCGISKVIQSVSKIKVNKLFNKSSATRSTFEANFEPKLHEAGIHVHVLALSIIHGSFFMCTVTFQASFHHHSINSYDNIYGEWLNEPILCVM